MKNKITNIHLCLCNNCQSILEDTNPQINAPLYNVGTLNPEPLIQIEDMKACPFCKTDAYLSDDVDNVLKGSGVDKIVTNLKRIS